MARPGVAGRPVRDGSPLGGGFCSPGRERTLPWCGMQLPLMLEGRVAAGRGRGKGLGMPTANLGQPAALAALPWGVYRGWAWVAPLWNPALAHWGPAATFGETTPGLEVHVLDFSDTLVGVTLPVCLVQRVRQTRPFPTPAALQRQLQADERAARVFFATASPPSRSRTARPSLASPDGY